MILPLLLAVLAADTVRVTAGDPAALRAAVAGAPPGSVVLVPSGAYAGPLTLDRRLTVLGIGRPVLDAAGTGSVIRILAPGVRVAGLVLRRSGADLDKDDAGVTIEADSAVLEDLVLEDVLHGVYLRQVRHAVLRRVTIRGRRAVSPNLRGDGLHFYSSMHILAEDNDIADVRDGIYFSYSDTTIVRGTRVRHSRYGLHYMFSHANTFEYNSFTESSAGSSIMNSRDVIARYNVFAWNRGAGSYGLLQQTTERTILERNAFVGNGVGMFLDGAIDGVVRENLVAHNFVGLELFGNATGNRITGNVIAGNTYAATGNAAGTLFCVDGRGNYWSGSGGWDLDGDGIQDVPFDAASPLTELSRERPALRLFLGSPAATVLSWAERALPVFTITGVSDACPLDRPMAAAVLPPLPAPARGAAAGVRLVALLCAVSGAAALLAARTPLLG